MYPRRTSALVPPLAAAALLAGLLLRPAALTAAEDVRATADFARAEKLFQTGRLAEAIPLYRRVAATGDRELRAGSYARLAEAHGRLGRLVEAVQDGLRARPLLEGSGGAVLRSLDLHLGEAYLRLGHYATAERYLRSGLAIETPLLPPADLLRTLTSLARCAERRGDRTGAERGWLRVEAVARTELDQPAVELSLEQRTELVWRLADSYFVQHKHAEAVARLEALLRRQGRRADPSARRDTCRRLADHHAARGEHRQAEKYLRQVLVLHGQPEEAAGLVLRGDLGTQLAEALERQGEKAEATAAREQAADSYRAVLKKFGDGRAESAWGVAAFWKLEKLYQRISRYRLALDLANEQLGRWAALGLLDPSKVRSEQGSLQFRLGALRASLPLLRQAVADFEKQEPVNLIDLPPALLNLGIAEYRTADWEKREPWLKALERAEAAAGRALELYRAHRLPEDLVVVEAHHLRGVCAAERGAYHRAVEHFRSGATLCEKLGRSADRSRSLLLLDMALLHKSQGDLDEALRLCRQAREVLRTVGETDELEMAAFDAAEVVLFSARGRLTEAYTRAQRLLELCRKHHVEGGPLLEIALHCQGLHELSTAPVVARSPDPVVARSPDRATRAAAQAAERSWNQLRVLQEKEGASPLLPRTLNYLGLAAQWQGRWTEAEGLYRQRRTCSATTRRRWR